GGVLGVVLDDERVDAVFVMYLAAGHRRVEDAQHTEVRLRANRVLLVAVEEIKGARGDGELLPGLLVHQLGLTLDAVHEFDVVGVLERRLGARVQDGLVEGETDFLPGKDDPTAAPVLRLDVVIGVADLVQAANDHWCLLHPLNASVGLSWDTMWGRRTDPVPGSTHRPHTVSSQWHLNGKIPGQCHFESFTWPQASWGTLTAARAASTMMSRPEESSSSVAVSGGRSLATSSSGPAVSRSSPRSTRSAVSLLATSVCAKAKPSPKPRPRTWAPVSGCSAAISCRRAATMSPLALVSLANASSCQNRR